MSAQPEGVRRHPLADCKVVLNARASDPIRGIVVEGAVFEVLDYWDVLPGNHSWRRTQGNWAVFHYETRAELTDLPLDDEVVYGHIGPYGHLVHVSELGMRVK